MGKRERMRVQAFVHASPIARAYPLPARKSRTGTTKQQTRIRTITIVFECLDQSSPRPSFLFSLFPFPFPLSASASGDPGMAHAAIVGRSNVAVAVERSTASRRTKLRLELGFAFVQPLALFCRVSRTELRAHPLQTLRKAFTGLDLFGRIAARSGLAFYGSLPLCRRCGANTRRLVAVDSLEVELLQLRRGGARPIREGRDTVDFALEDRCGRLGIGRRPISSSQQRGNAKQGVRTHDTSLSIANWEPPVWRDNDRQGWRISWGSA